ncbi:phage tail assembly chaperone [Rhodopseudomonas boonkerdii]|uniref:rcc01693 family protein n=1 Tax=Rhodopseudomonas boonkerdii TaxID=475937 RepID=UPI001E456B74|nr:rcc01693 family protein [Rhodopseudomonas boonkerdii]UGV26099.1 phage tail assembly chaperone [Rhodopseudomonas boonkerdii]
MTPFPWQAAMQIGFGVLRLSPEAFWRMTPRELAAAMTMLRGAMPEPIDRARLDDMMRRFPDREVDHE